MRNFITGYRTGQYQTRINSIPIENCGRKGTAIPIQIDWASFSTILFPLGPTNPNFRVIVNLQANPDAVPSNFRAMSIYVDNTNVDYPVYVTASDTQYTVPVAANASGWFVLISQSPIFYISAKGIGPTLGTTLVFFSDIMINSYLDPEVFNVYPQYRGSPFIQNTDTVTAGFSPPALGDQIMVADFAANTVATVQPIIPGPPIPGGAVVIITEIRCQFSSVVSECRTDFRHTLFGTLIVRGSGEGEMFRQTCQLPFSAAANFFFDLVDPSPFGFIKWSLIFTISPVAYTR